MVKGNAARAHYVESAMKRKRNALHSIGMQPAPQQKPWRSRALSLLVPAYFLTSLVLQWNNAEWTWLGFLFLTGMAALLEAVWAGSGNQSKAARIALTSLVAGAVILFAAGGWRHFVERSSAGRSSRPGAITAPITVTPPDGIRGRTLSVTVDGRDPVFTGQSTVDFGPGIKTVSSEMKSATTLVAAIEIAPDTPTGKRRISITTPERPTVVDNSTTGAFSVLDWPPPLR